MNEPIDLILTFASRQTGVPVEQLHANSAIYQDLGLTGDDVDEFAAELAKAFGDSVYSWPWQRFTNCSEPTILTALAALARLPLRLLKRQRNPRSKFERLELGHIAAVIKSGHWQDP